jgi:PRD1 phage membrane DNA delivery
MNSLTEAAVTIFMAIIGVAILSVLVSNKSNTTGVIQSVSSLFVNSLATATSPVTGSQVSIQSSFPGAQSVFGGLTL